MAENPRSLPLALVRASIPRENFHDQPSRLVVGLSMTKSELLAHLADTGEADATEVASALGVSYSVAAMGLLRLVRQGLATRSIDPHRGTYWYELTDRGQARLEYLRELDS